MIYTYVFLLIIIALLISLLIYGNYDTFMDMVESNINFKSYPVQELPNNHIAADKLAKIELFIDKLLSHLNNNYPDDERTVRLNKRLDKLNIQESEIDENTTSYTVNKGEIISVCVRNKDNNTFHEYQLLLFVVIHELAHVASTSFGHNDEFNENFIWLLNESQNVGYQPQDYNENPVRYCGMDVKNNPLY